MSGLVINTHCCCWWWWQLQRYRQTAAVGSGMPLSHLCFELSGQASGASSSPHIMVKCMQVCCCCYFSSCSTYALCLRFFFFHFQSFSYFLCVLMLLCISLRFELSVREACGILDSIHNSSAFNDRSGLILQSMKI